MFERKKDYGSWNKISRSAFYQTRKNYLYVKKGFQHSKTILFYPQFPKLRTSIHKVMMFLGLNISNDPSREFDLLFCWEDKTFRGHNDKLHKLLELYPSVNGYCTDISKQKVAEIFEEVFGYGLSVDPFVHRGYCVKKSNFNSWHDGKIVNCPVNEKIDGFVYERVLSDPCSDGSYRDYRVPVVSNSIPFVSPRYHLKNDRFGKVIKAGFQKTGDIFTKDEVRQILSFCQMIGFDYGELDIIRNGEDEKIYIVDANNTPFFPSRRIISEVDKKRMIKIYAEAFESLLT